ncbi:kinesin-like protein KIF23 isoform X1 [Halyomorpha halys]|uniref:kinesin-like protein KIF23 isoform X1 n=2 Tax=Halyomorpha halys TaxID=286706 RepID=UPI0006D51A68|nr:kinesin-like protein KIF23 isoform X1 [Halyomorpha halys]
MNPVRNRMQNKNSRQKNGPKESMEVFCRVRPVPNQNTELCLKVEAPSTVILSPPSSYVNLRNAPTKEMHYTFKKVFQEQINQKEVFESVALPLIENLLNAKNGLLFTYGVTGSGKTHTMIGTGKDGGIMPRCIDTIFNSIGMYKTNKYVFKPDKLNGFDIQSESEAITEMQQEIICQTPAKIKNPKQDRNSDQDLFKRIPTETKITNIDIDNAYAVFVTFVEIYNNSVYDLLEEFPDDGFRPRAPQVKIIREDADHNMFVHGVNEVEVSSADEAFEAFYRGQKRRRIAHTTLNAESSRAHTIFTVRVVQAPIDQHGQSVVQDKKYLQIGQLSLVDLAGSERTNRTKNTGQRLREAGNINNSLMTLRNCLELLRENQKGANKMIPYRDSRLTHLFKTYFEGEGQVSMIVCVNPQGDDYDENLQVMKFAEISQEVQIAYPPTTPRVNHGFTPGRRRANNALKKFEIDYDKENQEVPPSVNGFMKKPIEIFADIPSLRYVSLDDNQSIKTVKEFLENQLQLYNSVTGNIKERTHDFREMILKTERTAFTASQEIESIKSLYEREKERTSDLESRVKNSDSQVCSLKRKVDEYELNVKRLKRELSEKDLQIHKTKISTEKAKEQYTSKIAQTQEKLKTEIERRVRSQKSAMEFEARSRDRKLRDAKRVLSDEALRTVPLTPSAGMERSKYTVSTPSVRPPSPNFRSTGRRLVNARRARRSRSLETWLEHRPPAPLPLPTILQPVLTKRRSVSKLTDAKDMVSGGVDKYCLVTQGQDSDGDLEARIYKGDVLPTTGGGVQVKFSDVEILKQKSPSSSPSKRMFNSASNAQNACSIAIEGHGYRR